MENRRLEECWGVFLAFFIIGVTLGSWFIHPILGIVVTVFMGVPTLIAFGFLLNLGFECVDKNDK